MSRAIAGKLVVEATLEAITPLSVGEAGGSSVVDMALAIDGRGRPYVPGSSLMGVLRAWIERNVDGPPLLVSTLCGYQEGNEGHASWLTVADAVVTIPDGLSEEVRHGVQIARGSGVARDRFLFTRTTLPRGTTMPLRLELDLPREDLAGISAQDLEKAVGILLEAIEESGLKLGAAKSRGLGRVALAEGTTPSAHRYDWRSSAAGLFDWLSRRTPALIEPSELGKPSGTRVKRRPADTLAFTVHWEPVGSVMSKSGFDGLEADAMPLVGGLSAGKVAPVLTGAGIKGVLRAHAARIVRTILGKPAGAADPGQPVPDADLPIIVDLFGGADFAGRVFVADVYQKGNVVDAAKWRAEDAGELSQATTHEDHVGIDRFLGGQAAQRLYSARTPRSDGARSWEPIRLEVDMGRPVEIPSAKGDEPSKWGPPSEETRRVQLALLLLVLRDLAAGLLPLGFGAQRGMGETRVTAVKVAGYVFGEKLEATAAAPSGRSVSIGDFVPDGIRGPIETAWKGAVEKKTFPVEPAAPEPAQALPSEVAS